MDDNEPVPTRSNNKRRTTVVNLLKENLLVPETPDLSKETEKRFKHFAAEGLARRLDSRLSHGSLIAGRRSQVESLLQTAWYKKRFYLSHFLEERYWYFVAGYFFFVVMLGASAFLLADRTLNIVDAIFQAASCVSQSGLSTINWSAQSTSIHIMSIFLMFMGSLPFLTTVPVMLRMFCFHKQWKQNRKRERMGLATKAELAIAEEQDLEARALRKVLGIVYGHCFCCQFLGFLLFYFDGLYNENLLAVLAEKGVSLRWHAIYLSVSSFQNNGLTLTPDSLTMFSTRPVHLLTSAFLILAGMTCFPIFMRGIASVCLKFCRVKSPSWEAYCFVLEHPRRCFTHMFPATHTFWLLLVVIMLLSLQVTCFLYEDWNAPELQALTVGHKFINAFFQAVTTRTAGLNSVDISSLSHATTFLFLLCMFISTSPTVVTMRYSMRSHKSAHAEELDITGRPEGAGDLGEKNNTVRSQARLYLTQHSFFLCGVMFAILCLERESLTRSVETTSEWCAPNGCHYGDYTTFKVLFELVSAYGTVGLSLGYRDAAASFSGALSRPSQLLLVSVMLLGRLRGLPDAIDPTVTFTMKVTGKHTGFLNDNDDDDDEEDDTRVHRHSSV